MDEEKLASGMSQVWRKGEVVLREIRPWSGTIHRLLRHLEQKGFDKCPRFLGVDESGREALSFVEGICIDDYPDTADVACQATAAREMGRLLRRYHDAAVDFPRTDDDVWMLEYNGDLSAETICHNDLGAYNVTFRDGQPCGLIDFDACCPAPRRWDLVYCAYRFAPLSGEAFDAARGLYRPYAPELDDQTRRNNVHALYEGYGLTPSPADVSLCAERLEELAGYILARANDGDEAFARMLAEGHSDLYLADAALCRERGAVWFC